ncbi:hypothetical protein HETIRDRAFT_456575 [Heterobasidion irregulare TC 32-1]|uniref:Importin-9 central HEAT repeats domain-containing protein n=1 Tax=Heterobasidion irregulare (strain TC 32-1) TaxID=747525 RepID=W4KL59_HETIT|nr:uncharacterized protein HETIRDRAFT_456575 [Heterobasidion irregulare TC 32-1]ETW86593.1 hypothetical protein HETIRDRAFT_456575 [Heterobasidion irregulare TC 32-1]
MASSADIAQLLSSTLNPDPNTRISAELKLSEVLTNHQSVLALSELILAPDVDIKYVSEHWSPYFQQFKGGAPTVQVKRQIREVVFQGLSDQDSRIRTLCAHIVSTIANSDWPDDYPDLLKNLIALLSAGQPNSVHGVMQVFTEFIRTDLTEDQILPVLRELLPALLAVLAGHERHSAITRARTISVFRQCVEALYMVKDQHPQSVKDASGSILPAWLDAFKVLLNLDPLQDVTGTYWDGLELRTEIFVVLDVVHSSFARLIAPFLPDYLAAALHHLVVLFPTYAQYYIIDGTAVPESSEGALIEIERLIAPMIDFVSSVARRGKAVGWFEQNLTTMMDILLQWAQMTKENEEEWSTDANLFVTQEDDETQTYCIRVAVFDLCASLLDRSPVLTASVLQAAIPSIVVKWRPLEALLAVIGSQSEPIMDCLHDEAEIGRPKPIDIEYLLREVVPSLVTLSECPFLQGRCLVFASRFAKLLSVDIAGQYLEAAIQVIESRETGIPFKISAVKAILHFCQGLDNSAVLPIAPLLETLSIVVDIDGWLTVELANDLVLALLEVWRKNLKEHSVADPILLSILTDIFSSIASSSTPGVYETAVRQALPQLSAAISNLNPKEAWITSSAIELISSLIEGAPESGLGEGFFAAVAPPLFNCLKTAEDRDILQNGIALVTLVVRVDVNQLLSWSDANFQSGLGNVINVIARMLHGQDESGGLVIGDLILHLLRKAGEAVLPVLLDLLEALLGRMRTAKTASFLQSLVIPFAFLIQNQRDIILDLVENVNIEGRSGLDILVNTWCENAETFQGFWQTRVSTLALSQLFLAERPTLQNLMVKGDIIVTAETKNVIQTRSKTKKSPHRFTSIPFHLKGLKLLLHEIVSNGEAAPMLAPGETADLKSDDGDDDWEDGEEDFVPEYITTLIKHKNPFDEEESLDQDEDEDLRSDPIAQIDLQAYLTTFLRECAVRNASNFATLAEQLTEEETVVLQRVVQGQGIQGQQ